MNIVTEITEPSILSTLVRIECTMYTSIYNSDVPNGNHLPLVVSHQEENIPFPDYHLINARGTPEHHIRLRNVKPENLARVAYQFAHELCHAWIGVQASSALVEVICECASWYFAKRVQEQTNVPYYQSLIEINEKELAVKESVKIEVPKERVPNHGIQGRNAMLRLAYHHLVPWLDKNPEFWKYLSQLGTVMSIPSANGDFWNNEVRMDHILNGFGKSAPNIVGAYFDLVTERAEFTGQLYPPK